MDKAVCFPLFLKGSKGFAKMYNRRGKNQASIQPLTTTLPGWRGGEKKKQICALFAWLISHQPTVLFSQNKPATSNQPEPASSTLLSEQTSTSHQPPANRTG
jgi:hypothetical protein